MVDEYGGIEGLLTHHDILEAIAGDIPFDGKPNDPKAVQRHDGSWLLDGMLSIEEFKEIFHLENCRERNVTPIKLSAGSFSPKWAGFRR